MSKKAKIILAVIIAILAIGLGGAWITYDKVTDYVITNLFESILVEDLTAQGLLDENGDITFPVEGDVSTEQTSGKVANSEEHTPSDEQETEGVEGQVPTPEEDAPSDTTPTPSPSMSAQDIQDRVKEIVKSIPTKDKTAMMKLVTQNISSSDIRYLAGLVSDGSISGADMAAAKQVALRSFNEEQLEDVKYYYSKYIGLFSELQR